jgi:lipopolysaccharide transport system permease protein
VVSIAVRDERAAMERHAALLVAIVRRDLVLKYRRSVLGVLWAQIAPLALLGVLTFVFTRVAPLGIADYPAHLFVGLLLWTWLQASLTGAADSVVGGADLVRQPRFPAALLPMATVSGALVQLLLAMPVLLVTVVVVRGSLPMTAIALPVVLVVQFALLVAPALVLAGMNVRYRDVGHLTGVVLLLAFYATPVLYTIGTVPARYRRWLELNPMSHVLTAARDCLLLGRWPEPEPLVVLLAVSVVMTAGAMRVFRSLAPRFAEEL